MNILMKQDIFETLEEELCNILCNFEKISTISKVLNQTLIENSDFEIRDSQNLCSILLEEITNTKLMLNNFENSFSKNKSSCR